MGTLTHFRYADGNAPNSTYKISKDNGPGGQWKGPRGVSQPFGIPDLSDWPDIKKVRYQVSYDSSVVFDGVVGNQSQAWPHFMKTADIMVETAPGIGIPCEGFAYHDLQAATDGQTFRILRNGEGEWSTAPQWPVGSTAPTYGWMDVGTIHYQVLKDQVVVAHGIVGDSGPSQAYKLKSSVIDVTH